MTEKEIYQKIVDDEPYCQLCGDPHIELHHVYEGRNRKNSTKYGMIVPLCKKHHMWVHSTNYKGFKQEFQKRFEETHTREDFIKIFGRSYL